MSDTETSPSPHLSDSEAKIKHDELASEKGTSMMDSDLPQSQRVASRARESATPMADKDSRQATPDQGPGDSAQDGSEAQGPGGSGRGSHVSGDRSRTPGSSRPRSTESQRPTSAQSTTDSHSTEQPHQVTFTVTIAQAIPAVDDEEGGAESQEPASRRRRIVEAPRAQHYYHCEYTLLPEDQDAVKTDIVSFGVAAKIYTDRQEPKVLKTWQEGDVTWVAWTHTHTIEVTDEMLLQLFRHTLVLRVWDTKDKLSARARFDRPKAFKLPAPKPGEDSDSTAGGGVKSLVLRQCKSFEKLQPKKLSISRPLPTQSRVTMADGLENDGKYTASGRLRSPNPTTLVQVPLSRDGAAQGVRSFSHLGRLAGIEPPTDPREEKHGPSRQPSKSQLATTPRKKTTQGSEVKPPKANKVKQPAAMENKSMDMDSSVLSQDVSPTSRQNTKSTKPRRSKQAEAAAQLAAELIKKNGVCNIQINMARLFSGHQVLTERLDKPSGAVQDMFVTLSVSGPLMSDGQRRRLNPLVLCVQSATNMPDTPLGYGELAQKCEPAYVSYAMFGLPEHHSVGRQHDGALYWDDVNVVLTGTLEPSELHEYLLGPPLEIQVHDRDRVTQSHKLSPALFGDDLQDEKISSVGTVGSRRTTYSAFSGRDKPWDPYGVAKIDLSGLLLGQQTLYQEVPIHAGPTPDVLGIRDGRQDGKLIGVAGAVDGPVDGPLPVGDYLRSGAALKVRAEIAHPLVTPTELAKKNDVPVSSQCPFARLVFKFPHKNTDFLHKLQSLVIEINATALDLADMPDHVVDAALATYKLSKEQQQSSSLDLVTGFHVLDGQVHLFVMEGLRNKAITRLWAALPTPTQDSDVVVLYHSDLAFRSRLYGPLDVRLCRVQLHEPLAAIVQQPLLYVRDMVPRACFLALSKLSELCQTCKLRDAVRNDLLPSAEMVLSMSKEFGVPMTEFDFQGVPTEPPVAAPEDQPLAYRGYDFPHTSRVWTPIDNYNENYMQRLDQREQKGRSADFSMENKRMVREQSQINALERSRTMPETVRVYTDNPHNYSTQTLNSTEQAKEQLRHILAKEPDRRYTYCPDYHHSMTVVPVNVEAVAKEAAQASHAAWKTPQGFTYPGHKTMVESNKHPRKLHMSRTEELTKPWEENMTLHYKPKLDRDRLMWKKRNDDMNLWTRPNPVFGKDEPITIHLAGQKLREEKQSASMREHAKWQQGVVVGDIRNYFHRCATETELRDRGFRSSNQVARLQGMLKDPPQKHSLRRAGLAIRDIPPLNVVLNPSVDPQRSSERGSTTPTTGEDRVKGFVPGPYREYSWTLERNKIPVRDYQHELFKDEKGHDFNVYHKERGSIHKRQIAPLTDPEYDTHLFRWDTQDSALPPSLASVPPMYALPDLQAFRERQTTRDTYGDRQVTHETLDSGIASLGTKVNTMEMVQGAQC